MNQATSTSKAPWHFRVVCVTAVIWNGFGAYDWLMSLQGADYYLANGFNEAQAAYQTGLPVWMQMAWSVGVWTAVLGTILLISRRRQAFPVFVVSLAGALASLVYQNLLTDGAAVLGPMVAMSWVIVAACAFLTWYAWKMTKQGLLR
jgi:hypothetical protein